MVSGELATTSPQAIYLVLNDLLAASLIRKFEPAGSPALYERRIGDNHHHLACDVCRPRPRRRLRAWSAAVYATGHRRRIRCARSRSDLLGHLCVLPRGRERSLAYATLIITTCRRSSGGSTTTRFAARWFLLEQLYRSMYLVVSRICQDRRTNTRVDR